MRSFSSLREHCAHTELLKLTSKPSYARDKAADLGTRFHKAVELWVRGENPFDAGLIGDSYGWFQKMRDVWTPPPGCQAEVAVGLDHDGTAWDVLEPEPHQYVREGVDLATAGRLDLRWYEEQDTCLVVVDIKTGQSYLGDPWGIPQLVAQAVASLHMHNRINGRTVARVKLGVYYARLGLFDFGSSPLESSQVEDKFSDVLAWATMTNEPRPGGHCLSCYEKKQCAAYEELVAA